MFHPPLTSFICFQQDTAKYLVRAENENGFDEEWVELVVLGRPARPQGPLEVSNITADGCRLKWKAPLDDGGMPIQEYEIEKFCPRAKRWIKVNKSLLVNDVTQQGIGGCEY